MTHYKHYKIRLLNRHTSRMEMQDVTLRMEHDPLRNLPNLATGELVLFDDKGEHPTGRYFLVPSRQEYRVHLRDN